VVSLKGGESMEKYLYTVKFMSAKDDAKKNAIIAKLQQQIGPYVVDGTIQATSDAIHVDVVDVGEIYPLITS
jgi:hypothetical protein